MRVSRAGSGPPLEHGLHRVPDQGTRLPAVLAARQHLVVRGLAVADMGHDRQPHRLVVQTSRGRGSAHATGVLLAGVLRDGGLPARGTAREQPSHPGGERGDEVLVLLRPPEGRNTR